MGTTFLKRQKEMKRLDKAKMKAERREQKKLASRAEDEAIEAAVMSEIANEGEIANLTETVPAEASVSESKPVS